MSASALLLLLRPSSLPPAPDDGRWITMAEAREYLRVDGNDEDMTIRTLIDAAAVHIENYCGVIVEPKLATFGIQAFGDGGFDLPRSPVRSIVSVDYGDGEMPGDLRLIERYGVWSLWPAQGAVWPVVDGMTIVRAEVGFATRDDLPEIFRGVGLMLVALWFADREGKQDGNERRIMSLLDGYRRWIV